MATRTEKTSRCPFLRCQVEGPSYVDHESVEALEVVPEHAADLERMVGPPLILRARLLQHLVED